MPTPIERSSPSAIVDIASPSRPQSPAAGSPASGSSNRPHNPLLPGIDRGDAPRAIGPGQFGMKRQLSSQSSDGDRNSQAVSPKRLRAESEIGDEMGSDYPESEADEIADRLLGVESHMELYGVGEQACLAQRSFLNEYGSNTVGLILTHPDQFHSNWDAINAAGKLTVAEQSAGAKAADLTDPAAGVASDGAGPCLIGFAEVAIQHQGAERVFGSVIHVSADSEDCDVLHAYETVYKPLCDSISSLAGVPVDISQVKFEVLGAEESNPKSLRLAAALVHAAREAELNLAACKLPSNTDNQVTSAMMRRGGLTYTVEDV